MLLEEVVQLFLHSRKRGTTGARKQARPQTLVYYEKTLDYFLAFMHERGIVAYEKISKIDMLEFFDWMDKKKRADGEPWSKSTKLKILRSLRAFFRFVERDEDCTTAGLRTWGKSLPVIEQTPSRKFIPATDQLKKFKAAFDTTTKEGYRDFVAFCMMLDTGARRGELAFLQVDQLKLTDKVALMPEEGKTSHRLVPLSTDLIRILRGWLKFRQEYAKCDYVFVNRSGKQLTPGGFSQAFAKLRRKFGLAEITPHTLRHAFCTYYLKNGGNLAKLKMISGHSSYDVLNGYLHLAQVQGSEMQAELERVSPLRHL